MEQIQAFLEGSGAVDFAAQNRTERYAWIEKARTEAEAKIAERRQKEAQTGSKAGGRDPKVADPEQSKPEPKAQRNFTDPDSRIMLDGANTGSFVQAITHRRRWIARRRLPWRRS